ncbi:MAG: anhydro-N-acetylmuramic acid kinase, partial [Parvularculaceae bacterium]
VCAAEEAGWRGDALEAECFAYLAVRSLKKLPLSYPGTTRVPVPTRGGVLCRAPL